MATVNIPELPAERVEELVRKWTLFGRSGRRKSQRIVRFLGPFYAPGLSFALKPLASQAFPFPWIVPQRFGGIRVVTPQDFCTPLSDLVKSELYEELPDPEVWVGETDGGARLAIRVIEVKVKNSLGETLQGKLVDVFGEQRWNDAPSADGSKLVVDVLHRILLKTLTYAVAFSHFNGYGMVLPEMGKTFLPLLELWRSGNLPLGFDVRETHLLNAPDCKEPSGKKANAVVLCAEA